MDKEKLMKELIADEGFEYEIYLDHLGYPTLGVGHLVTEKDEEHGKPVGTPVSEQRIRECLDQDIEIVCSELDRNEPWWRHLDDNRQAAREMMDSKWSGQVGDRAKRLRDRMLHSA